MPIVLFVVILAANLGFWLSNALIIGTISATPVLSEADPPPVIHATLSNPQIALRGVPSGYILIRHDKLRSPLSPEGGLL
jgi:hypothetical protein